MRERQIQKRLIKQLNTEPGCKARVTLGGHTIYGEPDILGCYHGQMIVIEVKTGDGVVSEIQKHRLKKWEDAGAYTVVWRQGMSVSKFLEAVNEFRERKV